MGKVKKNSKIPLGNILWWWLGLLVYYIWFQCLYNSVKFGKILAYSSFEVFLYGFICNFLPIAIIWWIYIGIVYRWIRIKDRLWKIVADVLSTALVAVAVNLVFAFIFPFFTGIKASIDWSGTLLNDFLVLMLIEISFHFKSLILYQTEVERMRQEVLRQQYNALKAQVNPHFLFNSFNLLYSLVTVEPQRAHLFIQNLAEMYRYVLDRHGRDRVQASEELEFIKSYIGVLMIRFRNKFSVNWTGLSCDSPILAKKCLIPFSLQILVENVVKHNIVSTRTPMNMEIHISEEGLKVSNPLRPRQTPSSHGTGFGLSYLVDTYMSEKRVFNISDNKEEGRFEVFMEWLPDNLDNSENDLGNMAHI